MAANAFLSGFTGGMGAMSNVMNYAEQRQQRQQQLNDQQTQRNISALMHIDQSFGDDDEKHQQWRNHTFESINQNKNFRSALELEQRGANITGIETTADGFIPIITYEDEDGKSVTRPVRMDDSEKALVIPHQDFFQALGSQTDILDSATRYGAQLLGAGGSLPEKPETFRQEMFNGVPVNISNKTNEVKGIAGMGGSGSGSGSGTAANPRVLLTNKDDDHQTQYTMEDGNVIRTDWVRGDDGKFGRPTRSDGTADWNKILQSGNVRGRMEGNAGGDQDILAVDTRPFYEWGPGMADPDATDKPEPEPEPDKPKNRPPRTSVSPNQLNTGYGNYTLPQAAQDRATQARSDAFDQLAEFAAKQKQVSQIGQQNLMNARTNYGGMIGQDASPQLATPSETPADDKSQVEQAYQDVERIMKEGNENELIDYLKQLDPSVIQKITQMNIQRGNLVAKGGNQ